MKGFKEFKARMESDEAFREKFRDVKDEEQLLALTRAEGYDIEQISEEDLDAISGGVSVSQGVSVAKVVGSQVVNNTFQTIKDTRREIVTGRKAFEVAFATWVRSFWN